MKFWLLHCFVAAGAQSISESFKFYPEEFSVAFDKLGTRLIDGKIVLPDRTSLFEEYKLVLFTNIGYNLAIEIPTDAQSWLGVELGKSVIDTSGGKESLLVRFKYDGLAGGDYSTTINIILNDLETQDVIAIQVPFKARIEAFPDAFRSSVDWTNCSSQMDFMRTCTGTVTLKDYDGFGITRGGQASNMEFTVTETNNSTVTLPSEKWEENGIPMVRFTADKRGGYIAMLKIFQVPMTKSYSVQVSCEDESLANGYTCNCPSGTFEKKRDAEFATECVTCPACDPGKVLNSNSTCGCRSCASGYYCPTQSTEIICPMGHKCSTNSVSPVECDANTFSNRTGLKNCHDCTMLHEDATTMGIKGAIGCTLCPMNSNCNISRVYEHQPSCDSISLSGEFMLASSANFDGSVLHYVATPKRGFYRFPPLAEFDISPSAECASVNFYECPYPETCQQDTLSACTEGYSGHLCMACADGYAKSGRSCTDCTDSGPYTLTIVALVVISLLTVIMTYSTMRKAKKLKIMQQSALLTKELVVADAGALAVTIMKIAFSHFQVMGLVLTLDLDWDAAVNVFSRLTSSFTLTGSDVTSAVLCMFGNSTSDGIPGFYKKVMVVQTFPLAVASILMAFWFATYQYQKCKKREHKIRYLDGFVLSVMILLFLAHLILVRTALELFSCTEEIQGRSFLVADTRIECYTGNFMTWILFAGVAPLVLYGLGIPVFAWLLLRFSKNHFLYAFLCRNYKEEYRSWEVAIALRKVIITVFVISFEQYGPLVQAVMCVLALVVAIVAQLHAQPFTSQFLNSLESASIICEIFSINLALLSVSGNESVDTFLNISIAVLNVAYFLYIVYLVVFVCSSIACRRKPSIAYKSDQQSIDESIEEEDVVATDDQVGSGNALVML